MYEAILSNFRKLGFETRAVSYIKRAGLTGRYPTCDYASVEDAKNTKAVLERHYPDLKVSFCKDSCASQWSTNTGKDSTKDKSGNFFNILDLWFIATMTVVCVFINAK